MIFHGSRLGTTLATLERRSFYAAIMKSRLACALVMLSLGLGCAVHDPRPAFRYAVSIGDRGISVPLPPPSLLDEPKQEVEVSGEVDAQGEVAAGTVVHIVDLEGRDAVEVELPEGERSFAALMDIDLTANCLETWVDGPDGESERRHFRAELEDARTIVVVEGCT